ncbi:phosphomannomutase [Falsirhodobacter xinxiangensis]|uniref:phosphomannomutase n=1 Tax=Falsirhodobacter xinxiangensis TaxID=2530049 RepID=UPI0010AA2E8A|nr:phosphomannomutase [Rhodobacter xinxiangensis]
MAPKFGTSGLRGLVTELTPELVAAHVTAFAAACPTGGALYVGRDLRPSSARIAGDVAAAGRAAGLRVVDCGEVPTPALALASISAGAAAVMVTGSHIPADRNGLKFYVPNGEISKADEAAILAMPALPDGTEAGPAPVTDADAGDRYVARYVAAFGPDALAARRIGVYSHSAVGRDLLIRALRELGAEVVELGRSETFIPVDTEAVDPDTRAQLRGWAAGLDAIVSTDGDGDRPLVTDAAGEVIPGDVLGQITARVMEAQTVVTPVSSNSGVDAKGFARVIRTRIGSPFVIAGMEGQDRAAGYEANGGFLLGFDSKGLAALMTRDSLLPIIAPLVAAGDAGLAALVAAEPACFTAADRLTEVPVERSQALVARLTKDAAARAELLAALDGAEARVDLTDGLRIGLTDGRVVHIRPSGNAPELRVYAEAKTPDQASALLAAGLRAVKERV